jgi:hypothetical protein
VGVNETLLGAYPCALQFQAGLRHGVLYVSSGHVCFETTLCAAAGQKEPSARLTTAPFRRPAAV